MSATRRDTTAQWSRPAPTRWFTARAGTTSLTSVLQCGTAGHTLTEWERASPIPPPPDGASASDTAMVTIRGTTRGGGRWAITDAAGIRITDGARGAELLLPTSTASGATPHIHVRAQPGQIRIPAI